MMSLWIFLLKFISIKIKKKKIINNMSKFFIKIKELFTTFTYEVKNFYNLVTKNTQNTGFYYKFFTFKFYMMLLYPFAFFYFIYF